MLLMKSISYRMFLAVVPSRHAVKVAIHWRKMYIFKQVYIAKIAEIVILTAWATAEAMLDVKTMLYGKEAGDGFGL